MAYTLPSSIQLGESTGRGLDRGTNLYNMLMQHAMQRAQNKRAEELQPYTIKHLLSQIENANAANSRAEQLFPEQLTAAKHKNDPDYAFNNLLRHAQMAQERFSGANNMQANNNEPSNDELLHKPLNQNPLEQKLKEMGMFGQQQEQGQGALMPEE